MRRSILLGGKRVSYVYEPKLVRRVNIRIRDGELHVSAPALMPPALLDQALIEAQDWILERLGKRPAPPAPAVMPERVFLWGEELRLARRAGKRRGVTLSEGVLTVTLPDPESAEDCRRALAQWQKRVCAERIEALCRQYYPAFERRGVAFPSLSFRRMKTRWGSCRPQKGALSFNTRLAELPPDCADYVVVHELAHFLQANHSPAFYAEVERVLPDWKARRARIRAWEKAHPME